MLAITKSKNGKYLLAPVGASVPEDIVVLSVELPIEIKQAIDEHDAEQRSKCIVRAELETVRSELT